MPNHFHLNFEYNKTLLSSNLWYIEVRFFSGIFQNPPYHKIGKTLELSFIFIELTYSMDFDHCEPSGSLSDTWL